MRVLIDPQKLRNSTNEYATKARKTLKLRVYRGYARDIAQNLGKAVVSDTFCGIDYYKDIYEDDKIVIEADRASEWDTRIFLKIENGIRPVLDPDGYLEGEWMKYVSSLKSRALKAYYDANHSRIDDSALFSS